MHHRGLAQLVERLLWEQEAASSSLASPTIWLMISPKVNQKYGRAWFRRGTKDLSTWVRYHLTGHKKVIDVFETRMVA